MDSSRHSARDVRLTESKPALRVRTRWRERFRSRLFLTVMVLLWVVVLLCIVWWAMSDGVDVWPDWR